MFNLGVILGKQLLLLFMVVKRAVVSFGMTMLRAVNVTTLASGLNETDFAIAHPTLIGVCL